MSIRVVVDSLEGHQALVRPVADCTGCAGSCFSARRRRYRLPTGAAAGIDPGARELEISMRSNQLIRAALWAYGLPLGMMLFGATVAALVNGGDAAVLAGALAGVWAACVFLRRRRRALEASVALTSVPIQAVDGAC